jgi:hypothetical protein
MFITYNAVPRNSRYGNEVRDREYDFDGHKITIPARRRTSKGEIAVNPDQSQKLAESYHELMKSLDACYGTDDIEATNRWGQEEYIYRSLDRVFKNLYSTVASKGSTSEKALYRLDRRSEEFPLFKLDLVSGCIYGLKNKQSPLIVGAKRVSADLAARLSNWTDPYESFSYREVGDNDSYVTASEMVEVLKETRKYAEETLKAVKVPVTDENVTLFLQLLSVKTIRVVKESLAGMPWLKTEKQVDKNLAAMVGMGLSYERLLVFNIADDYPKDKDELEVMLSVPHEWMAKAVVI